MVKKILFQFICYSVLSVVSAFAVPDGVVLSGDVRIIDGGSLVFSDGSVLNTAPSATAPNPYNNIVTKTCTYSQLKPTEDGKCFCPAAQPGYKSLAVQGGVGCDKRNGTLPSLEAVGMMDDWYGGWCFYLDPLKLGADAITEDVPQEIQVKCIYVPL